MTGIDFDSISSKLGVSVSIIRFLSCLFASLPISYFHRLFKSTWARHLYSFISGLSLCCIAYGTYSGGVLLLAPVVLSYLIMCLNRKHCGNIVFVSSFAFLVYWHVQLLSGNEWRNGNVDFTGTLMVLTLKIISCAMDYQDGYYSIKDEEKEKHYPHHLNNLPSFLEYLGFVFFCGSILVGPVYHFHTYNDFSENKKVWNEANPKPSCLFPALRSLLRSFVAVFVHKFLTHFFTTEFVLSNQFLKLNFIQRLFYVHMLAFSVRWMYYFIWSVSEASLILSGLGFSGYSNDAHPKPQWKHAKNVNIKGVELSSSTSLIPAYWNIGVGNWLRYYVFSRLIPIYGKSNVLTLILTQVVSALWHGLYPGYYFFFVNAAFAQHTSKIIYKFQSKISEKSYFLKHISNFLHFLFTQFTLSYSQSGFILLSGKDTLQIWSSLYFCGTLLPILVSFLLTLVPSKQKTN